MPRFKATDSDLHNREFTPEQERLFFAFLPWWRDCLRAWIGALREAVKKDGKILVEPEAEDQEITVLRCGRISFDSESQFAELCAGPACNRVIADPAAPRPVSDAAKALLSIVQEFQLDVGSFDFYSSNTRRWMVTTRDGTRIEATVYLNLQKAAAREWLKKWQRTLADSGYSVKHVDEAEGLESPYLIEQDESSIARDQTCQACGGTEQVRKRTLSRLPTASKLSPIGFYCDDCYLELEEGTIPSASVQTPEARPDFFSYRKSLAFKRLSNPLKEFDAADRKTRINR